VKFQIEKLEKPIEAALRKEEVFRRALFERPQSLGACLPYDEFIKDDGMFLNKDGSLGVVFEAKLLEHEPMMADQIKPAVDSLKTWFSLPPNCVLQVLYDQAYLSPLDEKLKKIGSFYSEGHKVSKKLFEAKFQSIMESCQTANGPLVRRLFVTLRYFPDLHQSLRGELLKRGEAVLFREMKEFVREKRAFKEIVADFQSQSRLVRLTQLDAEELLDVLRRFFNPKTYYKRPFCKYNPHIPLADQIIYNSPTCDSMGIEREGVKTRTLSLKTTPQEAYPGGMAYFTELPFPFRISMSFSFPSQKKIKTFFDIKEFFLQNTPSARARRQRDEVLDVQERLAKGDRGLYLTFNVIVEGENDDVLDSRVREIVNIFQNNLECETVVEDAIGLGLCLNSLPLQYSPKADYSSQRYIRILRSDATKFVPIFDSFRGVGNRWVQLFLSREQNLVPFSLLGNETSNHTVVLADSGSGKSAFVIDSILAAKRLSPEPLVFIVDKKASCVMAAEYFDGDLTVFDRTKPMPFTPFRGVYDEEKIAFLTNLLFSGIKMTSPNFSLDSIHVSAISKALKLAYVKKCEQAGLRYEEGKLEKVETEKEVELNMDDFVAELGRLPSEDEFEKSREKIEALIEALMPFYGDGLYASYFRGTGTKPHRKGTLLYAYDLDALDSDPILQALMTASVMEEIRQIIKLPENQGRMGFIEFEELGRLGKDNPIASRLLIDFAETTRKLGVWLIGVAPRPQNYFETEAGRAMWDVADNFLFLQMSADSVAYLKSKSELLDEANSEIIKSLRTKNGEYADVFYMNKKKTTQGAFRYTQTPYDRWLAPTNAKDAAAAKEALLKFKNKKWEALEYLAKKYPKGVEHHERGEYEKSSGM